MTGRRRYIRDINSSNGTVRAGAERNAINAPIQGTAADMIKIAMVKVHAALREGGYETRMLLQVHDELLFEVPAKELAKLKKLVKEEMEGVYQMEVPIVVEIGVGPNWRDLD